MIAAFLSLRVAPYVAALLVVILTGCSGPLSMDTAIGTLPVPNSETDCQIRVSRGNVEGGGLLVSGSGGSRIVSIIGARNCSTEMLDEALGIRRVPVVRPTPDLEERVRAIEAVIESARRR